MIQHNNMNATADPSRAGSVADRVSLETVINWLGSETNYIVQLKFKLRGSETWRATYRTINGEELEVAVDAPAQTMMKAVHQKMVLIARIVARMIYGEQVVSEFECREIITGTP